MDWHTPILREQEQHRLKRRRGWQADGQRQIGSICLLHVLTGCAFVCFCCFDMNSSRSSSSQTRFGLTSDSVS
jgi:hypothetical protein